MDSHLIASPKIMNADVPWDRFDSAEYHRRNYATLLPEDRELLGWAGEFLTDHFTGREHVDAAVDVGAGTNLYPALLMLPWASRISLIDVATSNVAWLAENVGPDRDADWPWAPFWQLIAELPGYREVEDAQGLLAGRSTVRQSSIFTLERARWDLGTMFFVADAMTADEDEFAYGVECFLRSLRPGAPFVAAFMRQSEGYTVADQSLPAVSVDENSLADVLERLVVRSFRIRATKATDQVVRTGYEGMLLATGLAA